MRNITLMITMMILISLPYLTHAKKKKEVRKVQEVSFGDMDLKGTSRNPEGAYLVQKRGIKFLPLFEVQKDFDKSIRESAAYMK